MKILVTILFLFSFAANAGNESNGGNTIAAEFVDIANRIVRDLKVHPLAEVNVVQLQQAIAKTQVVVRSEFLRDSDGNAAYAVNYPNLNPQRIEISEKTWPQLSSNKRYQKQIVFHEYLPLIGVNDKSYRVSQLLVSQDVCDRNPQVLAAIRDVIPLDCSKIDSSDLAAITGLQIQNATQLSADDLRDLPNLRSLDLRFASHTQFDAKVLAQISPLKSVILVNADIVPFSLKSAQLANLYLETSSIGTNALAGAKIDSLEFLLSHVVDCQENSLSSATSIHSLFGKVSPNCRKEIENIPGLSWLSLETDVFQMGLERMEIPNLNYLKFTDFKKLTSAIIGAGIPQEIQRRFNLKCEDTDRWTITCTK